jgi:hypothetical protein
VAPLTANRVPFTEVSGIRAALEEAYTELTRDAAEYRTADTAGDPDVPGGATCHFAYPVVFVRNL